MMDDDDLPDEYYEAYRRGDIPRFANHLDDENYLEEMQRIPLFMTEVPDHIDPEKHPELAALQAIINDDLTPEEQATYYKDHGNEYFKKGDKGSMKMAIGLYSDGINVNDCPPKLLSILHTNRAACHLNIDNFKYAFEDAKKAWEYDNTNVKACYRASRALINIGSLKMLEQALVWIERGLEIDPENASLKAERQTAVKKKAEASKKKRIEEREKAKERERNEALKKALLDRNVKIVEHGTNDSIFADSDWADLLANPTDKKVKLNDDGKLSWPVFFLYPEAQQYDVVEALHEDTALVDMLHHMFETPPPWDENHNYKPEKLQVLYECHEGGRARLLRINANRTLKQILSAPEVTVIGGTPAFLVVVEGSAFAKDLLNKYK
eukprot:Colp12_sorted_trinity150504_noHs@2747